ncbi:MAG: hypothetical protein DIU54_012250 [Acidobacteriota bacterium]|nr:MAG: hypothetical protein DIU54_00220 [Acidobacteriota bacterium]
MSKRSQSNRPAGKPRDLTDVLDELEMDDTLDDTFPASDSPSWTSGVEPERLEASPADRRSTDED